MEIILASVIAFIATNLDDIFLLTLFYSSRQFKNSEIIWGQLLGIFLLIAISLIGSLIGLVLDKTYIGLLGFIPIVIGIRAIWELGGSRSEEEELAKQGKTPHKIMAIAGVTIANGGDNVGIYIPLFTTLSWMDKWIMCGSFLILKYFWCLLARYFISHPYIQHMADKYGHKLAPIVLIVLGLYIVYVSESITLLSLF